jgi:hypothetical protein
LEEILTNTPGGCKARTKGLDLMHQARVENL